MAAFYSIAWIALFALISVCSAQSDRQCTGVRVGEVTPTSAIIWARLTSKPRRTGTNTKESEGVTSQFLASIEACPGAPGSIQIDYSNVSDFKSNLKSTPKISVTAATDFSSKFKLGGLLPDTVYYYKSKTSAGSVTHTPLQGQFKTAPLPTTAADVTFTVLTCQRHEDLDNPSGFNIYPSMAKLNPNFLVSLGDLVYYDNEDPSVHSRADALYHWQQMYSLPYHTNFLLKYPSYFSPDDHDTLENDCGPTSSNIGTFSFKNGQEVFKTEFPVENTLYRTFPWGKDVQIWILDSRSYRSNNDSPDGPNKTLLGAKQKAWLKSGITNSKATWRIVITPVPIIGPDEVGKSDNLSNVGFKHEGDEIRKFLSTQKNLFIITGDRHWQYHSLDPSTGLHEFCGGPASDLHATEEGGPGKMENLNYHKFYRVAGGFTSVKRTAGSAGNGITVSLHSVKGAVLHSYTFKYQA